jgi:hypothetical protein
VKAVAVLIAVVVLLLATAACAPQSSPTPTPIAVEMTLRAEPEPLTVGDSTLIVTLGSANGAPIDGATLQVHGTMDHEGMEPVDRESSAGENGEYRVPFEWTMGGGWIVTVTARLPNNGGEVSETFEFFVEAMSAESIVHPESGGMDMDMTPEPTAESD